MGNDRWSMERRSFGSSYANVLNFGAMASISKTSCPPLHSTAKLPLASHTFLVGYWENILSNASQRTWRMQLPGSPPPTHTKTPTYPLFYYSNISTPLPPYSTYVHVSRIYSNRMWSRSCANCEFDHNCRTTPSTMCYYSSTRGRRMCNTRLLSMDFGCMRPSAE